MEKVTLRELKSGIQLQLQVKLNKNLCTMKREREKKTPPGWVIKQLSQTFFGLFAASGDSASGRPQYLGVIVFTVAQKGM